MSVGAYIIRRTWRKRDVFGGFAGRRMWVGPGGFKQREALFRTSTRAGSAHMLYDIRLVKKKVFTNYWELWKYLKNEFSKFWYTFLSTRIITMHVLWAYVEVYRDILSFIIIFNLTCLKKKKTGYFLMKAATETPFMNLSLSALWVSVAQNGHNHSMHLFYRPFRNRFGFMCFHNSCTTFNTEILIHTSVLSKLQIHYFIQCMFNGIKKSISNQNWSIQKKKKLLRLYKTKTKDETWAAERSFICAMLRFWCYECCTTACESQEGMYMVRRTRNSL